MNTFQLIICSPDGELYNDKAVNLSLRGIEGDLAIMAGHIPFVTSVAKCIFSIESPDGTIKKGHTDGGLLTVTDNTVTLLSGSLHW